MPVSDRRRNPLISGSISDSSRDAGVVILFGDSCKLRYLFSAEDNSPTFVRMILRSHWLPYCNRPVFANGTTPPPPEEKGSLARCPLEMAISVFVRPNTPVRFVFCMFRSFVVCGRCRAFFFCECRLRRMAANRRCSRRCRAEYLILKWVLSLYLKNLRQLLEPQGEGEVFNIVVFWWSRMYLQPRIKPMAVSRYPHPFRIFIPTVVSCPGLQSIRQVASSPPA